MSGYLIEILSKYRRDGLWPTFLAITDYLRGILAAFLFGVFDYFYTGDKTRICLTIRGNTPESDAFALINQLEESEEITHLCIVFTSELNESHLKEATDQSDDLNVVFVKKDTLRFLRSLLKSRIVLQKQNKSLRWYQAMSSEGREFVRLYHGPITKAYGKTSTYSEPGNESLSIDVTILNTSSKRSVGSDIELHFRAASESRHPHRFRKYGYPRFDRIANFKSSASKPFLSEESRSILDTEDTTDILYATTHKDGVYDTTFFPFHSFDVARLRDHLQKYDIRLFLRPHPAYDSQHEEFVDNELIYSAGQSFSNSSTEMMPFFDGLVTDYSSIYIEFLPFDRPIIFLKDDHERFKEIRGFAFDYDTYFPGPKIENFDRFLEQLRRISDTGTDGFGDQRRFVRRTFAPKRKETFTERVLEDIE